MEKSKQESFDYEEVKQKVREQIRTGQAIGRQVRRLCPLLQEMLNAMLEGEMEAHLDEEEYRSGNRRNGRGSKSVKTSSGTIDIQPPRDRSGSFEPEIIRKQKTSSSLPLTTSKALPKPSAASIP